MPRLPSPIFHYLFFDKYWTQMALWFLHETHTLFKLDQRSLFQLPIHFTEIAKLCSEQWNCSPNVTSIDIPTDTSMIFMLWYQFDEDLFWWLNLKNGHSDFYIRLKHMMDMGGFEWSKMGNNSQTPLSTL